MYNILTKKEVFESIITGESITITEPESLIHFDLVDINKSSYRSSTPEYEIFTMVPKYDITIYIIHIELYSVGWGTPYNYHSPAAKVTTFNQERALCLCKEWLILNAPEWYNKRWL